MKVKLNWVEDDNGIEGFLFEGAPDFFDAVSPDNNMQLIAHDLLEHDFKNDTGSCEHELMAVGAASFGRGNYGTVTSDGIITDITSIARDCLLKLQPTTKGIKKFDPIEWIIEGIDKNKLKRYIISEVQDYDIEFTDKDIEQFIKLCFQYIRIGARKAQKKYGHGFNLYNLFDKMSRELQKACKYFDQYTEELYIKWSIKNCTVKVIAKQLQY